MTLIPPLIVSDSALSLRGSFFRVHTGTAVTAGWLESCPVSPCFPGRACAHRSTRSSLEWVHSTLDLHLSLTMSLPLVSLSVLTEPVPANTDAARKQQVLARVWAGSCEGVFSPGLRTDECPKTLNP